MKRALTLFLSTILASAAMTQGGPGGRAQQPSILNAGAGFLYAPAVHKELGLSPAVVKKIQDKLTAASKSMTNPPSRPNSQSSEARRVQFTKQLEAMQKVQNECLSLLTPAQKARLRQITIQQMGANSMLHPEVKKDLALNATQEKKVMELVQANFREMFPARAPSPNASSKPEDRSKMLQEMMKKQEAAKVKLEAQATKVLTPAQQAKWRAMKGKPFKMDMMGMMRSARPVGAPRRSG